MVTTPQSASAQSRDGGSGGRRTRSSALRIIDPNTNRDVLTGEEVASAVATPTETQAPDLPSAPIAEQVLASTITTPASVNAASASPGASAATTTIGASKDTPVPAFHLLAEHIGLALENVSLKSYRQTHIALPHLQQGRRRCIDLVRARGNP
mgnify:CR=1 FL=1